MRTRAFLFFIAFAFPFYSSAQTSAKPNPLQLNSSVFNLGVNKNEQLVIITRAGEVAFADSLNGPWHVTGLRRNNGELTKEMLIENACYFNSDTGFVSGYISNCNGEHNIIYHTVNGGKEWEPVEFGLNGWVDDATCLDNGEAWLSVAGTGKIAYSKDYGFTWTAFSFPRRKERYAKIYFNKKGEGLIGSLWNDLAYTDDNGKTWTTIPTPLSQKKYSRIGTHVRPEIRRIAIFRDYLLVKQEISVFYSKKDKINWICLPDYYDFYTDPENSALFLDDDRGNFVRCDSNMQPVSKVEEVGNAAGAVIRNGRLFILGENKLSRIGANNRVDSIPIYTKNAADIEPRIIGHAHKGFLGAIGNKIYLQNNSIGVWGIWDYLFSLPFATDSGYLSLKDSNTILYNRIDDSLVYYNISDGSVEKRSKKKMIENFCVKGVQKLIFSKNVMGCFYSQWQEMIYEQKDGSFVLTNNDVGNNDFGESAQDSLFEKNDKTIDPRVVNKFVKEIPVLYQKKVNIGEFGFTRNDFDTCKRNILDFKAALARGENQLYEKCAFYFDEDSIDFDRLLALVDRVKKLDQEKLNHFLIKLSLPGFSTEYSVSIKLVNADNEVLEISNGDSPNTFYFPWTLKLNGSESTNTAIEISKFIEEIYPKFLRDVDKVRLLQTIVKLLYLAEQK